MSRKHITKKTSAETLLTVISTVHIYILIVPVAKQRGREGTYRGEETGGILYGIALKVVAPNTAGGVMLLIILLPTRVVTI
jgi:hypothetical protein